MEYSNKNNGNNALFLVVHVYVCVIMIVIVELIIRGTFVATEVLV